jgi:hypothetical protein
MMLNDVQAEIKVPTIPIKPRDEREKDFDEIEDLIEKLKETKGRKEKRRLLAIYNSKQSEIWSGKQ